MDDAADQAALSQALPPKKQLGRELLWLFPHLAAVYLLVNFCTAWLAGWIQGWLLPMLRVHSSSSRLEFLFSHLLAFSSLPAFLAGLINARFRHRAAQFVWLVPAVVLAYKLVTYSASGSVFYSRPFWSRFDYYFGGGFSIPEFHSWQGLFGMASDPDITRGMAQLSYTAPFYAGVAYSLAAWIALRPDLHRRIGTRARSKS
jgi:hypothetical protein